MLLLQGQGCACILGRGNLAVSSDFPETLAKKLPSYGSRLPGKVLIGFQHTSMDDSQPETLISHGAQH
jgi:hypothetical protein